MARAEAIFIESAGVLIGASKRLGADRRALSVELMSHEAVDTSAIEGEPLDRDSVQSSIRKHLGLKSDHRRVSPAEAGIEMMVDLYAQAAIPLSQEVLFRWRRLIANGRTELVDVGRYRTHTDPMQIVPARFTLPRCTSRRRRRRCCLWRCKASGNGWSAQRQILNIAITSFEVLERGDIT